MQILRYLTENHRELFEIVTAVHLVAMLVTNLTPTPKDDAAVGTAGVVLRRVYRAVEILAGIVSPLAKR